MIKAEKNTMKNLWMQWFRITVDLHLFTWPKLIWIHFYCWE